jgi:hypothetical protein
MEVSCLVVIADRFERNMYFLNPETLDPENDVKYYIFDTSAGTGAGGTITSHNKSNYHSPGMPGTARSFSSRRHIGTHEETLADETI